MAQPELARLGEVMTTLRRDCPWDARQTHRSLVQYLVEETLEVVEAIEVGSQADLREELGDLLLQVFFHAAISSESADGFDVEDVARGIADKLVARHPHVFAPSTSSGGVTRHERADNPRPERADNPRPEPVEGQDVEQVLAELNVTWEQRKAVEKGRTSVLEGIPDQLSAMAKASKIIGRARSHGVDVRLSSDPIEPTALGDQVLELVARAQAQGIDAEQAVRDAVRQLEATVLDAEARQRQPMS